MIDMALIPIFGIVFTLGGTVAVVAIALYFNYKKRQAQSQEILAAIEKGMEIPFPPPQTRNYYNQGLIWSAVGIALTIAIGVSSQELAGAVWGLLPLAVGIAFLLIARRENGSEGKEAA
ncbi:MAG: hypothetical protein IH988_10035 [Planctomycetes bacterium]|nr:hypothetical protein [Planctomycetota bacterium]